MRKYFNAVILLLSAVFLMFASCSLNTDVSGTSLSDSEIAENQTNAFSVTAGGITNVTITSGALGSTTAEDVVITFNDGLGKGCSIDAATVANAVVFYNLKATNETDGAPSQGASIPYTPVVDYHSGFTTITFTMDLSSPATTSNQIEVYINPAVLTANNGTMSLNLDGDAVQGEAAEDDFIGYIATAGTIVSTGSQRAPRSNTTPAYAFAVGTTSTTFTYDYTVYGLTTAPISKALLDAYASLERFNPVSLIWETISTTSTYTDTAGSAAYVLTHSTLENGDVLRFAFSNPYSFVTSTTVLGYYQYGDYDQSKTYDYSILGGALGAGRTGFNTAFTNADVAVVKADINDGGEDYKLEYTLNFSNIGAEGLQLASITTSTIKLYDTVDKVYVPWASVSLEDNAGTNNSVVLSMNSGYRDKGHAMQIHIGPGLFDLGATTATTDDVRLGDYDNVSTYPVGFHIVTPGETL